MLIDLKPGWVVCDIVANRGQWTAEAVKAGATVIAAEPLAEHREAVLAAGAAVVLPVAVSDQPDSIVLHIGQDDRFSSVSPSWVNDAGQTFNWDRHVDLRRVDTIRLDTIWTVFGPFDFIKVDCEGGEPAVIRSLGNIKPPRISIEAHGGKCLLQSLDGVTEEAIRLLGDSYRYRFAAESTHWASDWVSMAEAIEMLPSLDWGDFVCELLSLSKA
jgi:FkbM family methyltransferase